MKINNKKYHLFVIIISQIVSNSKVLPSTFHILNTTNVPIDVETLTRMSKADEVGTNYNTTVKTIQPRSKGQLSEPKWTLQAVNLWKANTNREDSRNFLGVLLLEKKPHEQTSCTFEEKPTSETSKYKNDQDKLGYGLYNLTCSTGTWIAGTHAGWTRRGRG